MRVLVTGAGGFIGSHLAETLASDHEVTALVFEENGSPLLDERCCTVVRGDIRDRAFIDTLVDGHDQVYHLAAQLNHGDPSPDTFFTTNVLGTRNVMSAALDHGVDRVVHTSSRVTIQETADTTMTEDDRHRGPFGTAYARTKYKAEKIAFEHGARGLDVVAVNPTLVYGPRELHTLHPLIRYYLSWPVRFRGYTGTAIDLVHVDDVVAAQEAVMADGVSGERYLIGGEATTIGGFLSVLDEVAGVDRPAVDVPGPLVSAAVTLHPLLSRLGLDIPVSGEQLYAMRSDTTVDSSRVRDLGVDRTGLRDGLQETVDWYRENDLL